MTTHSAERPEESSIPAAADHFSRQERPVARRGGFVGYALAIAIPTLWGSSFVLTKAAMGAVGPFGIAFVRWVISALVLAGWIGLRGRWATAGRLLHNHAPRVLWMAVTGVTLFYGLQNVALGYTSATNAGILSNMTTVFMVLIAVLWFGERLRLAEWLALGVALLGAILVSLGSGHFSVAGPGLRGDLLMLLSTVFAATYSMDSKRLTDRFPADVVTTVVAAIGALLLLPMALREGLDLSLPVTTWGALVLLGVGSGALANLWWLDLLSYMDGSRAGMVLFLVPVISTGMAVLFLGEGLTILALIGGGLVLAGVAAMKGKA